MKITINTDDPSVFIQKSSKDILLTKKQCKDLYYVLQGFLKNEDVIKPTNTGDKDE